MTYERTIRRSNCTKCSQRANCSDGCNAGKKDFIWFSDCESCNKSYYTSPFRRGTIPKRYQNVKPEEIEPRYAGLFLDEVELFEKQESP